MREYQDRRRFKRFLHSRYAIAILGVICLVLLHSVWGLYQKYEKSKEIVARVQSNASLLQTRETSLSQSINDLNTQEGRENILRDQFGVVKEGEKMVVIVDDVSGTDTAAKPSAGWWSRFLGFFGI